MEKKTLKIETKIVTLREHFSIKKGKEVFSGPCEIELTEQEIADNEHKLEAVHKDEKKKKKEN